MLKEHLPFPPSKNWMLILCVIVLASVGIRAYFAAGFVPKDDAEFAKVAYEMSQGPFDYEAYQGPPVIPVRTGIILPTAASVAMFGPGEVQLAIYPMLTAVMMILLVYLFAVRMFDHATARLAAIVWVLLPMEIEIATTLWPEVPSTAFAFLGVYLVYIARKATDVPQKSHLYYGCLAGLAFGASWLCKASVIYFVPFCALLIAFDFRSGRFKNLPLWTGVAAGSLFVLFGEMIAYKVVNDDWLYRFTAIERNYLLYPEFFFTEGARFGFEIGMPFWKAVVKRVVIDGPTFIFLNSHFLYLPLFGLFAALFGVYKRDERFYFLSILLVVLALMFNGFSASLENYQPLPLFNRYFYALCVPGVILTCGMIVTLLRATDFSTATRERHDSLFLGATVLIALGIFAAWSTFREIRDYAGTWSAAEKHLAGVVRPGDRIHTDVMSRNSLQFFWKYPASMNLAIYGDPDYEFQPECADMVLRNLSYNHWLTVNYGSWMTLQRFTLPEQVATPPENWAVLWTNQNATLFEVGCARDDQSD